MPFTLSHPAAAVPLAKCGLPLSALVVGSMAPDFPYFLHASTHDHYGHTLRGIFVFCVPVGLAALGLFHGVLKYPLLSLLPVSHQERLLPVAGRFRAATAGQWCLMVAALVLGAITHLVWDSFTQYDSWAAQRFPVLAAQIVPTPFGTVGVIEALHLTNSLVGAGLLLYWYQSWLTQAPKTRAHLPIEFSSWFKFCLVTIMVLIAFCGAGLYNYIQRLPIYELARHTIVGGIQILGVELLMFSFVWHIRTWWHKA